MWGELSNSSSSSTPAAALTLWRVVLAGVGHSAVRQSSLQKLLPESVHGGWGPLPLSYCSLRLALLSQLSLGGPGDGLRPQTLMTHSHTDPHCRLLTRLFSLKVLNASCRLRLSASSPSRTSKTSSMLRGVDNSLNRNLPASSTATDEGFLYHIPLLLCNTQSRAVL